MLVMRCIALAAALAALGIGSGTSWAQEKPDFKAAAEHYRKAEESMASGDGATAAVEYQVAFDITKDPVLYFKIGQAHDKAGNCAEALTFYQKYLDEAKPQEEYKARTEGLIATCKEKVAATTEPTTTPEPEPGTDTGTSTGTSTSTNAEVTTAPPALTDDEGSWQRTAAWTSVGVTIAFATTATVLALSARSREEDIDNLIKFRDTDGDPARFSGATAERYDDLIDEGERLKGLSIVAFAATGVAAGAAALFFVLDAQREQPGEAEQAVVTPTVSPDGVGVSAGWRF
jgi:tetratricopeptide (TPR) repeat protein